MPFRVAEVAVTLLVALVITVGGKLVMVRLDVLSSSDTLLLS